MKVLVCDMCKKDKGKLTETNRYISVKGRPDLRTDLCPACNAEFHAKVGNKVNAGYVTEVYRLHGMDLTPEMAESLVRRGW